MRKENIIDNEVSEILKCKDKRLPYLYNHKILYKGVEPYWQYKENIFVVSVIKSLE